MISVYVGWGKNENYLWKIMESIFFWNLYFITNDNLSLKSSIINGESEMEIAPSHSRSKSYVVLLNGQKMLLIIISNIL